MQTQIRPNQERAKAIIIIFWVLFGSTVLMLISSFLQYRMLSSDYDIVAAELNDTRELAVGILFLIVYILSVVFFIRWFRRAYYNLHQVLPANRLSNTEGWAAGSWFVHILNLFRPYQIMEEIWEQTQLQYTERSSLRGGQIIGVWWALFLLNNFLSRVKGRWQASAETIDELLTVTMVDMVQSVLQMGAILVTIHMITQTSRFEEKMFQQGTEVNILDHLVDD